MTKYATEDMSELNLVAAELRNRTEILGNDRKVCDRQALMPASIFKDSLVELGLKLNIW